MTSLLWIIVLALIGIPAVIYLGWITHNLLGRLCVRHARSFCLRRGLKIQRTRWQSQFEPSGVKTEFTLVQLDCFDAQEQRHLILLSVRLFGVRNLLSDESYPESYDSQWP